MLGSLGKLGGGVMGTVSGSGKRPKEPGPVYVPEEKDMARRAEAIAVAEQRDRSRYGSASVLVPGEDILSAPAPTDENLKKAGKEGAAAASGFFKQSDTGATRKAKALYGAESVKEFKDAKARGYDKNFEYFVGLDVARDAAKQESLLAEYRKANASMNTVLGSARK